jgi:hypothetical protein
VSGVRRHLTGRDLSGNCDDADDAETAGSGFALKRSLGGPFEVVGTAARDALVSRAAVPKKSRLVV